jgi:cell division septum initiation protein DivIVA
MNKRDQLLVLNILDYLTTSGGNPAMAAQTAQQFRQLVEGAASGDATVNGEPRLGMAEMQAENRELKAKVAQLEKQLAATSQAGADYQEAFEAQGQMLQITVDYLNGLFTNTTNEKLRLEDYLANMRRQDNLMREQVDAHLQMFQMTIDYLEQQARPMEGELATLRQHVQVVEEELATVRRQYQQPAEEALRVASGAAQTHFYPLPKLKALFADAFYVSHPEFTNGNVFCMAEKLGIVYLAMVKTPYSGLRGEMFALISNFYLHSIISNQKYINSSRLIERYNEFLTSLAEHTQAVNLADVQVAVCLIDTQNCEVEFSTTGFPIYTLINGAVNEYHGGASGLASGAVLQANTYKVKKLNVRKGGYLLLSSEALDANYVAPSDSTLSLCEAVLEACAAPAGMGASVLTDFLRSHAPQDRNNKDFLLAGVKF